MVWNDIPKGYKGKTIEKVLKYKINAWANVIAKDNKELAQKIIEDVVVTGGAIANMLVGLKPSDYDVYFKTKSVCLEVVNYYISKSQTGDKVGEIAAFETDDGVTIKIKSAGVIGGDLNPAEGYDYFELGGNAMDYLDKKLLQNNIKKSKDSPNKYLVLMVTDNAITLSDDIQVITRFCGNPEEIHKNFDFEHTKCYWSINDGLVLNQNALECIMSRTLKYSGSLYPLCSMFRLRKFINRGWNITAGEMLKIGWDISKLDLTDMNVLKEQLIGVDTAYFSELIQILKKDMNTIGFELDRSYLISIIDKVFDLSDDQTLLDTIISE